MVSVRVVLCEMRVRAVSNLRSVSCYRFQYLLFVISTIFEHISSDFFGVLVMWSFFMCAACYILICSLVIGQP